ncbi:uncharacterized protein METZ01_LOCUS293943, partial [marine metagenome]
VAERDDPERAMTENNSAAESDDIEGDETESTYDAPSSNS